MPPYPQLACTRDALSSILSASMASTPPVPPRNPYRRFSSSSKSPQVRTEPFRVEPELIPRPLFGGRLSTKSIHRSSLDYPSPGSLSPLLLPSDVSTIASNRSSIVSDVSSRPSTSATSAHSETPSRTPSLSCFSPPPMWSPSQTSKPHFNRSITLPSGARHMAPEGLPSHYSSSHISHSHLDYPIQVPALKLPPSRTSCFSPAPVWTPQQLASTHSCPRTLRRKEAPKKETLRTLRAKDLDTCLPKSPQRQTSVHRATKKTERPVALSNLRNCSMDAKGVFILTD
ncbi:hypothetical protein GQ44DRAFT_279972 [Phaeosphaeriaceae sp. PMI808]|nr:hypothetical protein GQ44DRAFT_279972 [Phaeosphaeriaceae sp. PMI808]